MAGGVGEITRKSHLQLSSFPSLFHSLMWEDKGGEDVRSGENLGRRRSDLIGGEIRTETSIPLDSYILIY